MLWILVLYILNAILMLIVAIREAQRPANASMWLIICMVFPVVSFGLYLIASTPIHKRIEKVTLPDESKALPDTFSFSASTIAQALHHLTVHGIRTARVKILTNGLETYENLAKSIQMAQRTIDVEYYIYRDDQIGRLITDLLVERAAAGVSIRFLRDGWGSRQFPHHHIIRMMDAGITCRTLFPVRFPWLRSTLNYRDHCKNVVIDGKEAITGGINIGDEYTGLEPNIGFWRDTDVRVTDEAVIDFQAIFDAHWEIASPEQIRKGGWWNRGAGDIRKPTEIPNHRSRNLVTPNEFSGYQSSEEFGEIMGTVDGPTVTSAPNTDMLQKVYIQMLEGNPGVPIQIIRQAYFICLTQAMRFIDITTPYFLPDVDIIMAIKTAVARGVQVRLLVPHKVDHKIVGAASRTYYPALLEAGVHIYLYDRGVLHAKTMTIDNEIAIIGAANYDTRSFRLDYEISAVIYSEEVSRELRKQFDRDLAHSIPLHIEALGQRSRLQRIFDQGARLLAPIL